MIQSNQYRNILLSWGGRDGKSSGVVSTPVAGGTMIASGFAGIAVYNPYRSFILRVKE